MKTWRQMDGYERNAYVIEKFKLFGKNHSYSRTEAGYLMNLGLLPRLSEKQKYENNCDRG